jgi:ABC-type glycerol-3-phosphate transport system permease component
MSIPIEMDEAAKIDGAGPIHILTVVLLPQIRPALAAVAIGSFTFYWSDFLRPLIYLNTPSHLTAAIGLRASSLAGSKASRL